MTGQAIPVQHVPVRDERFVHKQESKEESQGVVISTRTLRGQFENRTFRNTRRGCTYVYIWLRVQHFVNLRLHRGGVLLEAV